MSMNHWTPEHKERTLAIYREHGAAAASRETGVPRTTVHRWATESGDRNDRNESTEQQIAGRRQAWEDRRTRLIPEMGRVAELALTRATEALDEGNGRNAREFTTTFAILVDKAQLLTGGATSRPAFDPGELVNQAKAKVLNLVPQRQTG